MKYIIFLVFINVVYCTTLNYDINGKYYNLTGPYDSGKYDISINITSTDKFNLLFIYVYNYEKIPELQCKTNICFNIDTIDTSIYAKFSTKFYIILETFQYNQLNGHIKLNKSSHIHSNLFIYIAISTMLVFCVVVCCCVKKNEKKILSSELSEII